MPNPDPTLSDSAASYPVAADATPAAAQPPGHSHWPRGLRRHRMELLACALIGLGILMLLQPFALVLYTWSFVTMLAGVAMFMVVSKFPE